MKQVEFDIELVKKIQAGEIKGAILTRDGNPARFLGEIKDPAYPLVFAREIKHSRAKELLDIYTLTGSYSASFDKHVNDIILEIEEEIEEEQHKPEHQFKPFDKVLVRENDSQVWHCDFYSYTDSVHNIHYCVAHSGNQILPYEGNEHLVGTTDKPKET